MTEKIDELLSLVKALDTKFRFVMEDIDLLKTEIENIKDICITTAMSNNQHADNSNKSARLEQFKQATQRW